MDKLAWAKANPTFCIFPYATTDVRRNTNDPKKMDIICCCNADMDRIPLGPLDDPFVEIKKQLEAGELPDACYRCRNEEANGGQSERIRGILALDDSEFPFDPNRNVEFRIKFSNFCSLSCRSCSPTDSTTYSKITNRNEMDFLTQDVTEIDEYWNFITANILSKIETSEYFHLWLMGGETLIQPGVYKLLKWCIDQGLASRIGIKLSTALSVNLSEELLGYFNQFRSMWFGMSIDSVGDNYQYVRWPVKFEKIETNLTRMLEFKRDFLSGGNGKYFTFSLDPVFSLNNIFYIKDYLDYWNNWFTANNETIVFLNTTLVERTQFLDVQALPVKYRAQLKLILDSCVDHEIFTKYPKETVMMKNFICATRYELEQWPDDTQLWEFYLNFTAEFDTRTKTQWSVLNSKLYNILDDADKTNFNAKLSNVNTSKPVEIYFNR
jgi:hypothetical protein